MISRGICPALRNSSTFFSPSTIKKRDCSRYFLILSDRIHLIFALLNIFLNSERKYLFLLIVLLCSGCSTTKYFEKDEKLLVKNSTKIKFDKKQDDNDKVIEDLSYLYKQKINHTIISLGFVNWFRLRAYTFTRLERKKTNWIRNFLLTKYAEEPVIYDPTMTEKTMSSINNYLFNVGYFSNKVLADTILRKNKKKLEVIYRVNTGARTYIQEIRYPSVTDEVTKLLRESQAESLIKKGDPYNSDMLKQERERIKVFFQNNGYYKFLSDLIYFEADTSTQPLQVNINVKMQVPDDKTLLMPYTLDSINVFTDYSFKVYNDSSIVFHKEKYQNLNYLSASKNSFRTKAISQKIFLKPGTRYNLQDFNFTSKRLNEMNILKGVEYNLKEKADSSSKKLDVNIFLKKRPLLEYILEAEGTINDGVKNTSNQVSNNMGFAINVGLKNKNLFRGGEILSFNQKVGMDWVFQNGQFDKNSFISTSTLDLAFPKFLINIGNTNHKINNPKTIIALTNNIQNRYGYFNLQSNIISATATWNESVSKSHTVTPSTFTFFGTSNRTDRFNAILQNRLELAQSFQEQFIVGGTYRFIYDNALVGKKNPFSFQGNVDLAGNSMMLFSKALHLSNYDSTSERYLIFKKPFSQYVKFDVDMRKYFAINNKSSFVLRLDGGLGIPYGNSGKTMPYVKQFYIGGNNSIRAFQLRRLGPGSVISQLDATGQYVYLDQNGDIKMEANAELRFNIIKWFKGAIFVDGGNIWLLNEDANRPGAHFKWNEFYKQFALGTGMGLRMDLSYFIFRIDLGIPLRKPSLPENDRWMFDKIALGSRNWRQSNLVWNFALGYPF